jgi:hypothetical protein
VPDHFDLGAERLHRQRRLAAAFRIFARFGFDEGVAGFDNLYEWIVNDDPDLLT